MQLTPVQIEQAAINDAFWKPRIEQVRSVMLPYQWEALNDRIPGVAKSYAIQNFRIAAGKAKGGFSGCVFQDSDLGKWIEAVAYALAAAPDARLEKHADEVIDLIAQSQEPDGYLNTAFILKDQDKRWANLAEWHELYVAGHLMEAAVAYFEATGKRTFLDVMTRNAELIASRFGKGKEKVRGCPGHPEIELALVKVYRATGDRTFLDLAAYFVDERGTNPNVFIEELKPMNREPRSVFYNQDLRYAQAHKPVREQGAAEGHAVRAMYLFSGMADVAAETGDKELLKACRRLWKNVTQRRMYVTGGVGSTAHGEAFTRDYDLPNDTSYSETCAAIGLVFWAHRMLNLEASAEYADVMERVLYNAVLVGASQDAKRFFYANRLTVEPNPNNTWFERQGWFGCACCPPNYSRLLTSLGSYIYGRTAAKLYVHLYVGGKAETEIGGKKVVITQKTAYPWKSKVQLRVRPDEALDFTLCLRIPGWCRKAELRVNGRRIKLDEVTRKGYAQLKRTWEPGDVIDLDLDMPVEQVAAHPKVRQNVGRVALQRGPVVYCLEQCDNGANLDDILLPADSRLKVKTDATLFGGTPVIEGRALRCEPSERSGKLYRIEKARMKPTQIKAVPYFLWANRKPGEMRVWIRRLF